MFFVFDQVRLQWQKGQGYKHPHTGQWVETPKECLKGWVEPNPQLRPQWLHLVTMIEDFWPRRETNDLELGDEVTFT